MRIITVVLNADHAQDNDTAVFTATNQLLQYVLTHFKKVVVLEKGKPDQLKALPVLDSLQKKIQLVPKKKLTMIKALDDKSKTTFQVSDTRSEEHTSELQSRQYLVCRLLLEKKKNKI